MRFEKPWMKSGEYECGGAKPAVGTAGRKRSGNRSIESDYFAFFGFDCYVIFI
jgi:hypothetical protein